MCLRVLDWEVSYTFTDGKELEFLLQYFPPLPT